MVAFFIFHFGNTLANLRYRKQLALGSLLLWYVWVICQMRYQLIGVSLRRIPASRTCFQFSSKLSVFYALVVSLTYARVCLPSDADEPNTRLSPTHANFISIRVAGAQIPVSTDVKKNAEAIFRAIDFAAREKADVLLTPEGSLSGYTHKFDATATMEALNQVVEKARTRNLALVLGTCFVDAAGSAYDAQRFYDRQGNYLGFHAKILLCRYIPDPLRKGEVDFFKTAPLRVFQLQGLTVGGLVCNDMWANPEWTPMPDPYLARQLAEQGAKVIFHSVNAGQSEGEDLALVRAFHDSNLRIRSRTSRLWIVVADACDATGQRSSQCPSGVLGPDGRWAIQAESRGEQFFAHTIRIGTSN